MSDEIQDFNAASAIRSRPHMYRFLPFHGGELLRVVLELVRCGHVAGLVTAATVEADDTSVTVSWDGDGRLAELSRDEPWIVVVTRAPLIMGPPSDQHERFIASANDLVLVRAFSREFRVTVTNEHRTVTVVSDDHEFSYRVSDAEGPPHTSVAFVPDPQQVGPVASSRWPEHESQRLQLDSPTLQFVRRRRA